MHCWGLEQAWGKLPLQIPRPPQKVHLPFIGPMQRLQAQELPIIQAKGLEPEHFHLWVWSRTTAISPLRPREGLAGVRGLAAPARLVPHQGGPPAHMGQPCPARSPYSTRLQYKEQRTQKPSGSCLRLARAVSHSYCLWCLGLLGAPPRVPKAK